MIRKVVCRNAVAIEERHGALNDDEQGRGASMCMYLALQS
jgi:hypothetical protein